MYKLLKFGVRRIADAGRRQSVAQEIALLMVLVFQKRQLIQTGNAIRNGWH